MTFVIGHFSFSMFRFWPCNLAKLEITVTHTSGEPLPSSSRVSEGQGRHLHPKQSHNLVRWRVEASRGRVCKVPLHTRQFLVTDWRRIPLREEVGNEDRPRLPAPAKPCAALAPSPLLNNAPNPTRA